MSGPGQLPRRRTVSAGDESSLGSSSLQDHLVSPTILKEGVQYTVPDPSSGAVLVPGISVKIAAHS